MIMATRSNVSGGSEPLMKAIGGGGTKKSQIFLHARHRITNTKLGLISLNAKTTYGVKLTPNCGWFIRKSILYLPLMRTLRILFSNSAKVREYRQRSGRGEESGAVGVKGVF